MIPCFRLAMASEPHFKWGVLCISVCAIHKITQLDGSIAGGTVWCSGSRGGERAKHLQKQGSRREGSQPHKLPSLYHLQRDRTRSGRAVLTVYVVLRIFQLPVLMQGKKKGFWTSSLNNISLWPCELKFRLVGALFNLPWLSLWSFHLRLRGEKGETLQKVTFVQIFCRVREQKDFIFLHGI